MKLSKMLMCLLGCTIMCSTIMGASAIDANQTGDTPNIIAESEFDIEEWTGWFDSLTPEEQMMINDRPSILEKSNRDPITFTEATDTEKVSNDLIVPLANTMVTVVTNMIMTPHIGKA